MGLKIPFELENDVKVTLSVLSHLDVGAYASEDSREVALLNGDFILPSMVGVEGFDHLFDAPAGCSPIAGYVPLAQVIALMDALSEREMEALNH